MKLKILILCALLLTPFGAFAASPEIHLEMNGKEVTGDAAPFLRGNRTYVPLRFVGEALGMKVSYEKNVFGDDDPLDIQVTLEGEETKITVNRREIKRDGLNFWVDEEKDARPYLLRKNRTFVPIRYIGEALHMDVSWDGKTRRASLKDNPDREEFTLEIQKPNLFYCGVPAKFTPLQNYKIVYNGRSFILDPGKMTLESFLEKKVMPYLSKDERDSQGNPAIYGKEEYLYGANCFNLYREKQRVQGTICN